MICKANVLNFFFLHAFLELDLFFRATNHTITCGSSLENLWALVHHGPWHIGPHQFRHGPLWASTCERTMDESAGLISRAGESNVASNLIQQHFKWASPHHFTSDKLALLLVGHIYNSILPLLLPSAHIKN